MKLIQVNNNKLHIVELSNIKIAFSYKTPIAIMDIDGDVYITKEYFSNITQKHKNKITDLWEADDNIIYMHKNLFNDLIHKIEILIHA